MNGIIACDCRDVSALPPPTPPLPLSPFQVKQDSDELIDKVHHMLTTHRGFDYRQNCYWFSLTEGINKKLRAKVGARLCAARSHASFHPPAVSITLKEPGIATITSVNGMLRVLALHYLGILPFCPIDDAVFGVTVEEITLDTVMKEKAVQSFPLWVKHLLAFVFRGRPPAPMVAPALFAHLRERGMPVWFLGVNSDSDLKLYVEGVCIRASKLLVSSHLVSCLFTRMSVGRSPLGPRPCSRTGSVGPSTRSKPSGCAFERSRRNRTFIFYTPVPMQSQLVE